MPRRHGDRAQPLKKRAPPSEQSVQRRAPRGPVQRPRRDQAAQLRETHSQTH